MNPTGPKVVMIGDSITGDGSWSALFAREDILNRGIAGDTSRGLLRRVDRLEPSIQKAFIMIGINDLIWNESVAHIYTNYIQILDRLKARRITPIVQATLYAGKESAKRYNHQVEMLNSELKAYCKEENIQFIDLNDILSPYGQLDDRFTIDGIHLEDKAYRLWVEKIKIYL